MNPTQPSKFGQGRFAKETEHFCHQLQKLFGMSEPLALRIATRAANDAANRLNLLTGRPTIRDVATMIGSPTTCALLVIKACAWAENAPEFDLSLETKFALSARLAQWVAAVTAALELNDGGARAKAKVAAKAVKCPICQEWELDGQVVHLPNCTAAVWATANKTQKDQPSQKHQDQLKLNAAIASAKLAAKIGPRISPPSPKKSKAHHHSNWPPIIPGGGVETNRRKH